jgi:hypothetical protein
MESQKIENHIDGKTTYLIAGICIFKNGNAAFCKQNDLNYIFERMSVPLEFQKEIRDYFETCGNEFSEEEKMEALKITPDAISYFKDASYKLQKFAIQQHWSAFASILNKSKRIENFAKKEYERQTGKKW